MVLISLFNVEYNNTPLFIFGKIIIKSLYINSFLIILLLLNILIRFSIVISVIGRNEYLFKIFSMSLEGSFTNND